MNIRDLNSTGFSRGFLPPQQLPFVRRFSPGLQISQSSSLLKSNSKQRPNWTETISNYFKPLINLFTNFFSSGSKSSQLQETPFTNFSNTFGFQCIDQEQEMQRIAFAITSAFEGGSPGTLQTRDDGIISYGQHQATLASGALYDVLANYSRRPEASYANLISPYLSRVMSVDKTLRTDTQFLSALKLAGQDQAMLHAQDSVFALNYWQPAVNVANNLGLKSPLAHTLFYDTMVQGGLQTIVQRTSNKFTSSMFDEAEFLSAFIGERQQYLLDIAEKKRLNGKSIDAEMLENSAYFRVGAFADLLETHGTSLAGYFSVNGHKISGTEITDSAPNLPIGPVEKRSYGFVFWAQARDGALSQ